MVRSGGGNLIRPDGEAALKRVQETRATTPLGLVSRDALRVIAGTGTGAGAGVMHHCLVAVLRLYCLLRSPGAVLLLAVLGAALIGG